MKKDAVLTKPITSSFLSCEKDTEIILRKLFIESRPYSDILKRLLVIQAHDALDKNYDVANYSLKKLIDDQYIVLTPRIEMQEHAQLQSYIILTFDNFTPDLNNPEFRDCQINFDIVCHNENWDLGNYRLRPYKILGYIDGILNNSKLTGIGTLHFQGTTSYIINEDYTGFVLMYQATHGSDDQIPNEE